MKNMKLTHLSLSVLIALGLVACGGSDNKDNMTIDKDKHGETGGTGGTGPKGPKIENNGKTVPVDPKRAAPSLEVEANVATSTEVAKQLYIDRRSRDAVAGYNGDEAKLNTKSADLKSIDYTKWQEDIKKIDSSYMLADVPNSNQGGFSYNPGSTDAEDILRASSIYNYYEFQSAQGSLNDKGGIHANPNFSYAKASNGKYYRVEPIGVKWDEITATTKFKVVGDILSDKNELVDAFGKDKADKIPMSEVVFIPNALGFSKDMLLNTADDTDKNVNKAKAYKTPVNDAGNYTINQNIYGINELDPTNIIYFDVSRGEVEYKSFNLAGINYDLVKDFNTNNIALDLSQVPKKREIQNYGITLDYVINNTQSTGVLVDNDIVSKTAKVGEMKLYNLPYSRSSITVNQQAVKNANHLNAAPNNLFGFTDTGSGHYGAFQVVGFPTTAIPRDGRADYVGKSYGVNSVGDIELRADFAIERAGISGSVSNRKTVDGKKSLPSLTLDRIALVDKDKQDVASAGMKSTSRVTDGLVTIGGRGAGYWAVSLYGPNAEEAAGIIDLDNPAGVFGVNGLSPTMMELRDPKKPSSANNSEVEKVNPKFNSGKNVEVFSSQRGTIIKDSLNPGVGVAK